VLSDDATVMAERIRFLLLNPEIAASFGSRARQIAQERFSSTTQLANTLELYESVLAGRMRQEARV